MQAGTQRQALCAWAVAVVFSSLGWGAADVVRLEEGAPEKAWQAHNSTVRLLGKPKGASCVIGWEESGGRRREAVGRGQSSGGGRRSGEGRRHWTKGSRPWAIGSGQKAVSRKRRSWVEFVFPADCFLLTADFPLLSVSSVPSVVNRTPGAGRPMPRRAGSAVRSHLVPSPERAQDAQDAQDGTDWGEDGVKPLRLGPDRVLGDLPGGPCPRPDGYFADEPFEGRRLLAGSCCGGADDQQTRPCSMRNKAEAARLDPRL